MSNVKSLRVVRASVSIALIASFFGLNCMQPVGAQKETRDGVTVQKNADGSVDAYDAGDTEELSDDGGSAGGAAQNDGRVHYRPGTSPYQKKFSDGTTVRRNADGSIETWDEGETQHWSGGGGSVTPRKKTTKKTATKTTSTTGAKAKTTSTTVKKKAK